MGYKLRNCSNHYCQAAWQPRNRLQALHSECPACAAGKALVAKSPKPKVLIFDLETSGLDADFGTLLSVGFKWLGEKEVFVWSIEDYADWEKDPTNDKGLVAAFLEVYEQADLLVAYNGTLFDRPYLLAKCLEHRLPIPPNIPLQDPYFTVKSNLRISRKSLQNTAYFLKLSNEKTPVEGRIWKKAAVGDSKALKYIVDHCRADVLVLEELYLYLRPLMRTHWHLGGTQDSCRFCGEARLQRRGRAMTKNKGEVFRVQCQTCMGWDTRTMVELDKLGIY